MVGTVLNTNVQSTTNYEKNPISLFLNTEYLLCINILYYALEEWGKGYCGNHRREDISYFQK